MNKIRTVEEGEKYKNLYVLYNIKHVTVFFKNDTDDYYAST